MTKQEQLEMEIKNENQLLNLLVIELKYLRESIVNTVFAFEELNKLLTFDITKKHKEFSKVLKNLQSFLQEQISSFNVEEIKRKIDVYVEDLRKLSKELSLMAINTKIKSVNMGERGSTISVLSTEIKKAAELQNEFSIKFEEELANISQTLENLVKAFEDIHKNFESLVETYNENTKVISFQISKSYISELEYLISRFEKLRNEALKTGKLNKNNYKKLLENLKKFLNDLEGYISSKLSELEELFQNLEKTQNNCKVNQISVNKEYENIMKTMQVFEELILKIIKNLFFIENFSKTIENLRILMAIEVNRTQAAEFYSIVDAMNKVKQISDKAQMEMQKLFLDWQRKNERMKKRFKKLDVINGCIEESIFLSSEYQKQIIDLLNKLKNQIEKIKKLLTKFH